MDDQTSFDKKRFFQDYERIKLQKDVFHQYSSILEEGTEIRKQNHECMKEVLDILQEDNNDMKNLKVEISKLEEKVNETKASLKEIDQKTKDIKNKSLATLQKIKSDYFREHEQIMTLHDGEIQYLTEKLESNRAIYQEQLNKLKNDIEVKRATRAMEYENVKNQKQQQLKASHELLVKLQNEQKELNFELNRLKERTKNAGTNPRTNSSNDLSCGAINLSCLPFHNNNNLNNHSNVLGENFQHNVPMRESFKRKQPMSTPWFKQENMIVDQAINSDLPFGCYSNESYPHHSEFKKSDSQEIQTTAKENDKKNASKNNSTHYPNLGSTLRRKPTVYKTTADRRSLHY